MTIIAWLVIGAIAGWVAQTILKTRTGMVTMIGFGIVGAVVGGALGAYIQNRTFDFNSVLTGIDVYSIVVAIIGAVIVGGIGAWWARRSAT